MRDMTTGSIPKHMLHFTVPLLLSNVFQQLYNAVDTIIVGKYVGKEALAAVGSAGAIMNILMFLLVGVSLGASVLIAQYYGAHDDDLVRQEMGTAVTAGFAFTMVLAVVSFLAAKGALRLIKTPEEILPHAALYLQIIITSLGFTFLYNILSAALRALGDVRAPVAFLVLSSLLNLFLDIAFVRYLSMGIAGAAWATVISQGVAVALCASYIYRKAPLLHLSGKDLRIRKKLLGLTVQYSGIYAIQQCVLYMGVLLVQGTVNTLGVNAMAAYSVVTKVDNFSLMPGDSLASSLSTFVAQNKGAERQDRIFSGLKYAIAIGLGFCGLLVLAMPMAAEGIMGLFLDTPDKAVISLGASYLRVMAPLYLLTALCNSLQGFYRGLGQMQVTLNATFIQIPVRVLLAYVLVGTFHLNAMPMATGVGWICMIAYELFALSRYRRSIESAKAAEAAS